MLKIPFKLNATFLRASWLIASAALLLSATVSTVSAETLMMPDRDARMNESVVVWGVTTLPNGTAYEIDFGDLTTTGPLFVGDRSYIAHTHTYTSQGLFTATLTVGGTELDTAEIQVFNAAALTAVEARDLGVNMAIEDGLRYLWLSQSNRAGNFPNGTTTHWANSWNVSEAALVTLAFENHGYMLPNDDSAPTGLYEKYIVQRGLNYVVSALTAITIQSQPSGFSGQPVRDPCVGAGIEASPCIGLRLTYRQYPSIWETFHESYQTPVAILPLAASGALNRTNSVGYASGMTYGEILQRATNALAWGQIDLNNANRGGWYYFFNGPQSDGSTIGWALLAMLDADAAGATVPAWVRTEFAFALTGGLNNNGSLDYRANGSASNHYLPNIEKGGIPLQGMFLTGETSGARVDLVATYISNRWNTGRLETDYVGWTGCNVGGQYNKGCGYSMYNAFKGLKLQGIQTLPGVGRAAGPGAIPANDWHEDYKDWLITNQTAPNTLTGGYWAPMRFSSIATGNINAIGAAIAELILSPVALVLPDPVQFAAIGLQHEPWDPDAEPPFLAENVFEDLHTVTARTLSVNGTPVPGVSVDFYVTTGPNAGALCTGVVTNAEGYADCTYTSTTEGTDTIESSVGAILSNEAFKTWIPPNEPPVCGSITLPPAPIALGTAADVSATFTDPDIPGDTHTATWYWDDSTSSAGTVSYPGPAGDGNVDGSHDYTTPGVYSVSVTISDSYDETVTCDTNEFIVVYDPDAGFVTGGGWIDSPAGAFIADPELTGMANFGFVSKYKKGRTAPEGSTEFQFHAGGINFHSNTYEWLVIAGPKAMYKGVGTINGAGNFGFLLKAIDEKLTPSTDVDLFSIKIFDKDNGDAVVYDNSLGADINDDPATAISGGQIVIHKKK